MSNFSLGKAEGEIGLRYTGHPAAAAAKKDVTSVGDAAKRNSSHLDTIGNKAGLAGLAIAAGLGLAVKAAVSFEARLSGIAAVTGATGKQMDQVRVLALKLGKDTKFSADEAAVAIEELAKAGISLPDIMNGAAQATVALAAAGEVELPRAAEIAANAMNVFSLAASDLPHVADLIAGAANASAIDVEQFALSLQQSGAAAALAGIGFEDLTTAIALMGNAGIKGSDAGTSLKTMLLNLQPETKKQIKLMKDLGIVTADGSNKFFDAQGKAKGLGEIAGVLQEALKGQTKQQQLATLATLFGSDAIRAAAILAKNGAKGFDTMAASIGKVKAADVAAKRMDNFKGSMEQFKGSMETAGIAIGTVLLPSLRKLLDAVTRLVNAFLGLSPNMQSAITQSILAAGAFLLIFAAVLKVIAILSKLRVVLLATFVGNPIGLMIAVILGLAAAVFVLYQRFQPVRDVVDRVGRTIKQVFEDNQAAIQRFGKIALTIGIVLLSIAAAAVILYIKFQAVRDAVNAAASALLAAAQFLLKTFGPIFLKIAAIVQEFVQNIITYFHQIQPQLETIVNAISALFNAVFPKILAIARVVFGVLIPFIMGALQRLAAGISVILSGIANIFRGVFNIIGGIWRVFLSLITGQWGQAWEGVKQILRGALQIILGVIQQVLGGLIVATVGGAISVILALFRAGWNAVKTTVMVALSAIKSAVSSALAAVASFVIAKVAAIRIAFQVGWAAIRAVVSAAVAGVLASIRGLQALPGLVAGFFSRMVSSAKAKIHDLLAAVKAIPGQVSGALGDLGGLLFAKGQAIIQGFINGIKSMAGAVGSAVKGVLGKVGGMLPGSPVKEGPLTVLNRGHAGKQVVRMVIDGIESQERALLSALASVVAPVSNTILGPTTGLVESASRTATLGGMTGLTASFPAGLEDAIGDAVGKAMDGATIVVGGDGLARLVMSQLGPHLVKGVRR